MIDMIKVLHMEEKINALVETLSGGQKRKLSVGIALISGSKVHNRKHLHNALRCIAESIGKL